MNKLFFHSKIALIFGVVFVGFSCEKVIDVPIEDEDRIYVFEGVLKNRDSSSYFSISKTVGIYEDLSTDKISGATITVQDENMVNYSFTEDPQIPGHYVNYNFNAEENMTYKLEANVEGNIITSSSFSKRLPILDSIYTRPNLLDPVESLSQWVFYHSTDYVDEENYYRLRISRNGYEPSQYYIGNDFYINGETYEAQFFGLDVFVDDTVIVELLEMDPEVYDYIYGLSNTLITGPFSPTPANPPSNLEAGVEVLGYFAVYMTQVDTLIVH